MQRSVIFAEGEYYHLYNRGTEKRDIFLDDADRKRFLKLLYVANSTKSFKYRDIQNKPLTDIDRGEPLVAIGAYVLMPNHFHILVRETREGGISTFMGKLLTGYASYFNKRRTRTGRLFQGTFQARHADDDTYLKYLLAYIHLNPLTLVDPHWRERGIKSNSAAERFLSTYQYSSYGDYMLTKREQNCILSPREFPGYFETAQDFESYLKDWMTFRDSI